MQKSIWNLCNPSFIQKQAQWYHEIKSQLLIKWLICWSTFTFSIILWQFVQNYVLALTTNQSQAQFLWWNLKIKKGGLALFRRKKRKKTLFNFKTSILHKIIDSALKRSKLIGSSIVIENCKANLRRTHSKFTAATSTFSTLHCYASDNQQFKCRDI